MSLINDFSKDVTIEVDAYQLLATAVTAKSILLTIIGSEYPAWSHHQISQIKILLVNQHFRIDGDSIAVFKYQTHKYAYRVFATTVLSGGSHCKVSDITQIILEDTCWGYSFVYPQPSTLDIEPYLFEFEDVITKLNNLIEVLAEDRKDLKNSSLIFHNGTSLIGSIVQNIASKYNILTIHVHSSLLLTDKRQSISQSLRSAINCAIALEPCVLLIDDMDILFPSKSSKRFLQNPSPYQLTAEVITTFLEYQLTNPNPYRIVTIGLCQNNTRVTIQQISLNSTVLQTFGDVTIESSSTVEHSKCYNYFNSYKVAEQCVESHTQLLHKILQFTDINFESSLLINQQLQTPKFQKLQQMQNVHSLTFHGVCGHDAVKLELIESIVWPRHYPNLYAKFNMVPDTGVLLYGPPGTGKTYIVSVLAAEIKCHFVNIKLVDVVKGTMGTGERAIFDAFSEAKKHAPAIIFIDEFQASFTNKSNHDGVGTTLTYALNTAMDDVLNWNQNAGSNMLITVMAACNEPWAIDQSFLRHGRFDKLVYVGPLDMKGRKQYFNDWFSKKYVSKDRLCESSAFSNLIDNIVSETNNFTGADCHYATNRACFEAYLEFQLNVDSEDENQDYILPRWEHFDKVLKGMVPSVSLDEIQRYELWRNLLKKF